MNKYLLETKKLKMRHSHYKFLGSDSSGHSLSKDFWQDSNALRNLGSLRQKNGNLTQILIICQRQKFENKDTYLALLDLTKAYDSIPIYILLMKIYRY